MSRLRGPLYFTIVHKLVCEVFKKRFLSDVVL